MAYFPVTPSGLPTDEAAPHPRATTWTARATCGGILFAAIALTALVARSKTDGSFVYPVDDAYIHLAAAKHFVESGGHDRALFSASSSIAWPWLLVLARLASLDSSAPLVLNVVAALGLFAIVERAFDAHGSRRAAQLSLATCLAVPIVPLALSGMEHTLHAALATLVAVLGARSFATREKNPWLFLAAAGAVALRYEGAFVVGAVAILFLASRRSREAVLLAGAGALPALVRGVMSIAANGFFFPVPVMMKRTELGIDLPIKIYYRLIDNPHVLVTFVLLALAFALDKDATDARASERRALTFVAAITLAAHVVLAQLGWFYRYEAYSLAIAFVAIALTAIRHADRARAFVLPLAILALPIVGRAVGAFRTSVLASRNIFDQEAQTASFVRTYYDADTVALNDIGAVTFFTHAKIVDLMGLASPDIAKARGMRIDGPLSRDAIDRQTKSENARIAIVYDDWFVGSIPTSWRKVGTITIPDNHVCAKDTTSFYSVNEDDRILRENFRAFARHLPEGVIAKESF
ncbi:MAG: hypothetical protein ACRELY_12485 [Polyangiaceae bacterium]